MTAKEIYNNIRKFYFKHIIWPLFPIAVTIMILLLVPFKDVLNPKKVDSTADIIDAVKNGHVYLEISLPRLIYSGYDYMRDNDIYGEYYYDLVDSEKCVFFLVKPTEKRAHTHLNNVVKRVKVTEINGVFDNMLSMFASNINWTEEGVKDITEDYILSEVDYHYRIYTVILWMIMATLVYSIAVFLYNLFIGMFPMLSPKLLLAKYMYNSERREKVKGVGRFVAQVAEEMTSAKVCLGGMYITDNFFVNLDTSNYDIVPISKIVLLYEHSTLKAFLGIHMKVSYTLHIKVSKLLRFHAPKKDLADVNGILDYFREHEPDVLIGYTDENKQQVKELIRKSTSWFRK